MTRQIQRQLTPERQKFDSALSKLIEESGLPPEQLMRALGGQLLRLSLAGRAESTPSSNLLQAYMTATEFKAALKVCMEQRGDVAFLDEYLEGGLHYDDTQKAIGNSPT